MFQPSPRVAADPNLFVLAIRMKRLPSPEDDSLSIEGIRVFRTDIQDILDILTEMQFSVRLLSGEYEYQSLDEMRQHEGDRITDLKIMSGPADGTAQISVDISRVRVSLLVINVGASLGAGPGKLRERLRKFENRHAGWFNYYPWSAAGIVAFVVSLPLYLVGKGFALAAQIVTVVCYVLGFGLYAFGRTYLGAWLRYRRDGGWIKRNKDQIIVNTITGTLTAAVGLLVGYFIGKR